MRDCQERLYLANMSSITDNPRCYLDSDHEGHHEAYDRILGKVRWGVVENSIILNKIRKPFPETFRQQLRFLFSRCKICENRFCLVWAVYKDQEVSHDTYLQHRW